MMREQLSGFSICRPWIPPFGIRYILMTVEVARVRLLNSLAPVSSN